MCKEDYFAGRGSQEFPGFQEVNVSYPRWATGAHRFQVWLLLYSWCTISNVHNTRACTMILPHKTLHPHVNFQYAVLPLYVLMRRFVFPGSQLCWNPLQSCSGTGLKQAPNLLDVIRTSILCLCRAAEEGVGLRDFPHCRWGGESDDNDGTPPPDYLLQGPGYESHKGNLSLIRTDASDASTLSKGDSALDLTYLGEEASFPTSKTISLKSQRKLAFV